MSLADTGLNKKIKMECGSNPVISYILEIKEDVIDPQILIYARECAIGEMQGKVLKWKLGDANIQGCLEKNYKYTPEYIKKIAPLVDDAQENTKGIMVGYNQCVNNIYKCNNRFCKESNSTHIDDDSMLDSVTKFGLTVSLKECSLKDKIVNCKLYFTSNEFNRTIWWCGQSNQRFCGGDFQSPAYDAFGHKYKPSVVSIANSEGNYLPNRKLIADVQTEANIKFENFSSRPNNQLSLLEISLVIVKKYNSIKHSFVVSFTKIPFIE